jgi:regulatory protein
MNKNTDFPDNLSNIETRKVTRITLSQAQPGKVWVRAGGEKLLLDYEDITNNDIKKGMELSGQLYEKLSEKSRANSAYFKALNCLARQEYSKKGLYRKLRQKGVDKESAQQAAEDAAQKGYIDDGDYAKRLASSLSGSKALGARQVKSRLIQKGITGDDLKDALETLPKPEEGIQRLLRRKYAGKDLCDKKERERAVRFLFAKGYDWDDIRRALEAFAQFDESENDYVD